MTTLSNSSVSHGVLAVLASGLMLALSAGPAEAASYKVTVQMQDFQTADGRAAIDAKLVRAAERACETQYRWQGLRGQEVRQLCVAETLATARAEVAAIAPEAQLASR